MLWPRPMGRLGSACCRRIMAARRLWQRILVESQLVDVGCTCAWAELGTQEVGSEIFSFSFLINPSLIKL